MKHNTRNKTIYNGLTTALELDSPLNSPAALYYNSSSYLLTLNWIVLTYAYKSNGFIQTSVNGIVDDAFRSDGLIIESKSLDNRQIEQLRQALVDEGDIEAIKDCIRWGQLYGGGVLVANTDQNPRFGLDLRKLQGKPLKFLATDRWHCSCEGESPQVAKSFSMNSVEIDSSRVRTFCGVKAPYLLRSMLGGWGLSIFEAVIPPLNQYLKAMGVTLELLDEAKIDVIKIFDLATSLMSEHGENLIKKRLALVTENKNYKSSIAMDSQDDYQQKQISFSGLPEMIVQIQYMVCAALKRPYSKIFGKGSSGFSSGEDDLENYNSIVDSEIRTPATELIKWVVNLRAAQLFGRELDDFRPRWKSLRVLGEKEEIEIKGKKFEQYMMLLDKKLMSAKSVALHLAAEGIVPYTQEELKGIR